MKRTGDQVEQGRLKQFESSAFFAWRTPLLPFDELLAWGDGLQAPSALDDLTRLAEALANDRVQLRDRLIAAVSRPAVREAIFIAAPNLEEFFDLWVREPESKKGQRVELAFARYYLRMAGRATPFGLFAGCSVGQIGDETRLTLDGHAESQRHTRLDMDYLFALTEALVREPSLRDSFVYYPNSSLYRVAGRVRYVESRLKDKHRSYHLVAADETEYLITTLARGGEGATSTQLVDALIGDGIPKAEAEAFIAELIENQVLVPGLALPVTGPEPIHPLIEQLSENAATAPIADRLSQTRHALAAIDDSGVGVDPARYRALAKTLESLPARAELPRLFQVDLVKSAPEATLGRAVLDEIGRGVEVLHRLFGRSQAGDLKRFRDAFVARYEEQEVPLVEALDEEIGVGFNTGSGEAAPLLKGLAFPGEPTGTAPWDARDTFLLRMLAETLSRQEHEMVLEPSDLAAISSEEPPPLPDAFAVTSTVAAADDTALSEGNFRVFIGGLGGPSGARLLGRFCHGDEAVHQQIERHLQAEEALKPDAIFAEVVHLPEGRLGNILHRPVLRDYEITYLGRSGAASERQIPITDLHVSVRQGRIHLRSARLGREVVPRLTSAHAFHNSSSAVYRFLCALQGQDIAAGVSWDWGVLGTAPFLPRVVLGRLVLSLARWRINKEDIKRLSVGDGPARYQAAQQLRTERRLPRWVALADGDNVLPIDLDNVLSIETFVHLLKGREEAVLVEIFPGPEQLCARGPEGRFVHELIVPFVRKVEDRKDEGARGERQEARGKEKSNTQLQHSSFSQQPSPRRFAPGSEWLYAKLYTGATAADQVLREVVRPLTEELVQSAAIEGWFFVRYGDPDWHLRLRFNGDPERLRTKALPALQEAVAPFLKGRQLWRLQLDTYEREVERYGGDEGMKLSEQLFRADSEAVLEIIELLEPGDAGLDERWRLALRGMDSLLDDLGFDLKAKRVLLEHVRKSFAKEFRADERFIGQLGDRFREERKNLETLLDPACDADNPLQPGIEILERRSHLWASTMTELKTCAAKGRLSVSLEELASSYMHMHANRLLRSSQRAQEVVIYDFLARSYESRLARAVAAKPAPALCV